MRWLSENKSSIKETFSFAWPAILESFFVSLAGMVDTMMVSRLGEDATAAVGLTTQPKFIGLALFIATNIAVSALVARRKGEEHRDEACRILVTALAFTIVMGVIISLVSIALADPIMRISGSNEETHALAKEYFCIIMGGMMFNIVSLVINAAQRGGGNTRIAAITNVTSNVVNICGNYLLIEGHLGFPALGVRGAAIATVFGTVCACALSIGSLFRKDSYVSARFFMGRHLTPNVSTFGHIWHVTYSGFVEQIALRIGFMLVSMIAARLSTREFAAHQVGMNVMSLSFSFGDGLQVAAVTLIGQALGRGSPDMAKRYGSICQRIGNVISICLSIIYLTLGRWIGTLYFDNPETIGYVVQIMRVMVVIVLMQVPQVIYMGALRGAGDVHYTLIVSLISVGFVRPFFSWLFAYPLGMGVVGVWYGTVCDQVCRLVMAGVRFARGKWTKIKI